MSDSTKTISPLRQRMIEDMHMRKLNPKTQKSYLRHVATLGEFLGHSPHTATSEDLRRYQLHMVDSGSASGNINAQLSGLRFFFEVTLNDASRLERIKRVHQPRKIPEILSREEVADSLKRLIARSTRRRCQWRMVQALDAMRWCISKSAISIATE